MDKSTTTGTASPTVTPAATTIGDASAALALADSSLATPQTTDATPAPTPAAATAQPGDGSTSAVEPSTDGKSEPPKWRWQDILANARETSAKEAETRVRQEYDGLTDFQRLSAEERAGLLTWQRALSGDPAAVAHVTQVARTNPQVAQQLRGLIAAETPAQPAADPEPEADLQTGDGTPVFSAAQLAKREEWLVRKLTGQLKQQFTQEFQPLADTAQEIKARKDAEQQQAAQQQWASTVLAPIKRLPYYDEFKADIGKALTDPVNQSKNLAEVVWDTYAVLHQAKLASLSKGTEAQVLTDLQQRAVAATTNPATASSATPKSTLGNARAALEHAYSVTGA